jgi:predicted MPP superfamily phosphohydrolase
MQFTLQSKGRGQSYTKLRAAAESAMRVLYRGDWPRAVWSRFPGACDVVVSEKRLRVLRPGAGSVRVGFVSDLHLGPTTPPELARRAFRELAGARLDVLLMGGDYVFLDATPEKARFLADLTKMVDVPYKFFVLGNHDLWTHHALLEDALRDAGVTYVGNESRSLPHGLSLVGLDDPWTGAMDAKRALANVPDDAVPLFLCHSPDGLPAAKEALGANRRAIFICGHTHGGHVSSPFGPLVVPGRVGKQYPSGLHDVDDVWLYVSRGVGGIEVPFRTFAKPEVVVLNLTPPSIP